MFLSKLMTMFNAFPDRNAFCIQNKYYKYCDLFTRVSGIQHEILSSFPGEGRFGIWLRDDIDTYASVLAVLLSGRTYIPIHPHHPTERIQQIIQQSGLSVILGNVQDGINGVVALQTSKTRGSDASELKLPNEHVDDRNAYILFTSGSTGTPKGVPISYFNLNSFIEAFFKLGYEVSEQDKFLQMFDLTFDLSVMSYLVPLCIGACVYTVPENGIKYLNVCNILEDFNITFALMVPSILSSLRPYFKEVDLPDLRYSLFCGEALYKDLVTEWKECAPNAKIENVYGPTEATIFCLTYPIGKNSEIVEHNGIVTIGKPMDGMEAIVVDELHKLVEDTAKGELCLYGRQLTKGYLDPERNKSAFFTLDSKVYYRTGDIAYRRTDGNFIYCGRLDHQVKIQGYRVELSEIEFHLRKMRENANVVALFLDNEGAGLSSIEIVFEGQPMDSHEILDELKVKLPPYMMPTGVHYVSVFPINANGKTDRNELKKMISK